MQAVLLAAGRGTRMGPLTDTIPKPMLPVADRPLVAHVADAAVEAGADELIFVIGYRGDRVRDFFGAEYAGVPVEYVRQRDQRGTADAVRTATDRIDGPFTVFNGDTLHDRESVRRLFAADGPAVAVHRVENPTAYGVISTACGTVTDVVEKPDDPPTDLANAGAYRFPEPGEWLAVPESDRGEYELTDALATLADRQGVAVVETDRWLDVGRPWELLAANETTIPEVEAEHRGQVAETAHAEDALVEEGATVAPGSVVEGPAVIRSGATVGPNAYVRGPALIGPDASVGHAVEIKHSVLMAEASVSHLSYVGDSVLGRRVNIGAGTNVANLRHDDRPVEIAVNGDRVSTGRRKFGVVVGHDAKTGINTALNAGVTLSTGATTRPGETVLRDR